MSDGPEKARRKAHKFRSALEQCLVLARDEVRMLSRSRRGRAWSLAYLVAGCLPLGLYLWIRSRVPVPWPLDATVAHNFLDISPAVVLVLAMALGHDLLTRGEAEGWQDGFASLPVGEIPWLAGRAAGRLSWMLALVAAPYLIAYLATSLWAGGALNVVPFASAFLGGPLLALALFFPIAIIAGCLGNSFVGAWVILAFSLIFLQISVSDLAMRIFSAHFSLMDTFFWENNYFVHLIGGIGVIANFDYFSTDRLAPLLVPGVGLSWPPLDGAEGRIFAARLCAATWGCLLLAGPFLVRLRRRAGRWTPKFPSMPTFSAWVSETIDQVKPVRPVSRAGRWTSALGGLGLLAFLVWVSISGVAARARENEIIDRYFRAAPKSVTENRFVPSESRLRIEIGPGGITWGDEFLRGRCETPDRGGVPFALSPGMAIISAKGSDGMPMRFWREPEHLFVEIPPGGGREIRFEFRGAPQEMIGPGSIWHQYMMDDLKAGIWFPLDPLLKRPEASGITRWSVDLSKSHWAPEPVSLRDLTKFAPHRVEPNWGITRLEVAVRGGIKPLPLPGAWREEGSPRGRRFSWSGLCPHLPPILAGLYQVARSPGKPEITAASISQQSDLKGFVENFVGAWNQRPEEAGAASVALWPDCAGVGGERFMSYYSPMAAAIGLEPPFDGPAGLIWVPVEISERLPAPEPDESVKALIGNCVSLSRAQFRYAPLAPHLASGDSLARMLVWDLILWLESWPPPSIMKLDLDLGPFSPIFAVRGIDLARDSPRQMDEERRRLYKSKLDLACIALVKALGYEAADEAMRELSQEPQALDLDILWGKLAGDRSAELAWLKESLFCGKRISKPCIKGVSFDELQGGTRLLVDLANEGDAPVVCPLRVTTAASSKLYRVEIGASGATQFACELDSAPESVLLDPGREVLRWKPVTGSGWSRKGGLR